MGPIYNRIHLGLGILPKLQWQNGSVTNSLFWGLFLLPNKGPRARMLTLDPKIWSWAQKLPLGMKKQKMRAEKPCRTPVSEFQTEPYSESYGQKPFWRVPAQILKYLGGKSCSQKGEILVFKKGNPVFKKGNRAFEKGNLAFNKGNPACKKGKSCMQERAVSYTHLTLPTILRV